MATWRTDTTSTDDAEATGLEKLRDGVLGLLKKLIIIALLAIVLLAELFSMESVSDSGASPTNIEQEIRSLISGGATRELDFNTREDMELYQRMMTIARTTRSGNFDLEGAKAQEFWSVFVPEKSDTTLEYIQFRSETNHVLLRYRTGISSEITMEFDSGFISKAVTLREGVFNGNILSWLWWHLVGRFIGGYPRYVSEASLNGNGIEGEIELRKYNIRSRVFSWGWSPEKHKRNESISDHWT